MVKNDGNERKIQNKDKGGFEGGSWNNNGISKFYHIVESSNRGGDFGPHQSKKKEFV